MLCDFFFFVDAVVVALCDQWDPLTSPRRCLTDTREHPAARCSVVVIAVLMKMYGWSLDSAVEFVRVKNIEMELKRSHIEQLQMYAYK